MRNRTIKLAIFSTLLIGMVYYVGWVFYISEPTFIDNCYNKIERYDYVSIPEYRFSHDPNQEVCNGIVLQVDSNYAIIKVNKYRSEYYELDIKKSAYRIIGKGTLYHKVNDYVGFNIMITSQIIIIALLIMVIGVLYRMVSDLINSL